MRNNLEAASCGDSGEARCECGQLIAKLRGNGIELKCKRCKRIVLIPFTSIEGLTPLSGQPYEQMEVWNKTHCLPNEQRSETARVPNQITQHALTKKGDSR